MSKKETNPLTDWEIPTIWEIIDRMEFKWLFGEVKEEPSPNKVVKKKVTRKKRKKS
jgi:hypothetical protein|tara:strand:+ start:747 stop:914 length:168 start_codon:yes stop_codon:yes gene_type:complete